MGYVTEGRRVSETFLKVQGNALKIVKIIERIICQKMNTQAVSSMKVGDDQITARLFPSDRASMRMIIIALESSSIKWCEVLGGRPTISLELTIPLSLVKLYSSVEVLERICSNADYFIIDHKKEPETEDLRWRRIILSTEIDSPKDGFSLHIFCQQVAAVRNYFGVKAQILKSNVERGFALQMVVTADEAVRLELFNDYKKAGFRLESSKNRHGAKSEVFFFYEEHPKTETLKAFLADWEAPQMKVKEVKKSRAPRLRNKILVCCDDLNIGYQVMESKREQLVLWMLDPDGIKRFKQIFTREGFKFSVDPATNRIFEFPLDL